MQPAKMASSSKSFRGDQIAMVRQLEPDQEDQIESVGPIRRRIKALTVKLKPFETTLTDEEAINVRNTIESLLKSYFFEVQPWAIKSQESGEISQIDNTNNKHSNFNKNSIHDSSRYRESYISYSPPEGSVTYIGLAQIIENKQTEDQSGALLTMNGFVYFAEGSKNLPDETELLQTMETQALGDSEAVVEALKDFFPSQQQLMVSVETPVTELASPPPLTQEEDTNIVNVNEVVLESVDENELPPAIWSDEFDQEQQLNQQLQGNIKSQSSPMNIGVLGGGLAVAIAALAVLVGLFVVRRRRNQKEDDAIEYLVGVSTNSDDEHDGKNAMLDLPTHHNDWKAKNNNKPQLLALVADPELAVSPLQSAQNSEVNMSNCEFTDDGLSDFDELVSIQPHMVPLESLESFEEQHTNMTGRHDFVMQKEQLGSSFEQVPTSLLGDIDGGPRSPHHSASESSQILSNNLLLSNMHTGATTGSGGDLSYSDSSTSSQLQDQLMMVRKTSSGAGVTNQELLDQREDQRIQNSMMPNPYVHNRATVHARQRAAETAVVDRSASCVLQSTDFTASSLAKRRSNPSSSLSDTESSHNMGMVPKLVASAWWTTQNNDRDNIVRSNPTEENAREDDDLAYSDDEENTFGAADSDGWDPADSEVSLTDYYPGVMVVSPTSSTTTPEKKSNSQEPPGISPIKEQKQEPPGISPMRSNKNTSWVPSENMMDAKAVLKKIKSTSNSDDNLKSSDNLKVAKAVLQKMKSSPATKSGSSQDHKLGESIAGILDKDTSAEEIMFDLMDI